MLNKKQKVEIEIIENLRLIKRSFNIIRKRESIIDLIIIKRELNDLLDKVVNIEIDGKLDNLFRL